MYTCECGKKFEKSQSYIAHCSHCDFHLSKKQRLVRDSISRSTINFLREVNLKRGEENRKLRELKRESFINKWAQEGHICEYCGKIMNTYYGSGRFCCSKCSRAYASKIAKRNKNSFKAFEYGRNNLSPYESYIGNKLSDIGIRFISNATKKQYINSESIVNCRYILDFYLVDYNIDLEYDGRLHKDKVEHDLKRDLFLNSIGIKVYRIKHYDTNKSLDDLFNEFVSWLRWSGTQAAEETSLENWEGV